MPDTWGAILGRTRNERNEEKRRHVYGASEEGGVL